MLRFNKAIQPLMHDMSFSKHRHRQEQYAQKSSGIITSMRPDRKLYKTGDQWPYYQNAHKGAGHGYPIGVPYLAEIVITHSRINGGNNQGH